MFNYLPFSLISHDHVPGPLAAMERGVKRRTPIAISPQGKDPL